MHALSRALTRAFRPAPARRPDPHRAAREAAKPLAKEHGILIEREGSVLCVWPPLSFKGADPWDGDHGAQNWAEALVMVRHYAGIELFTETN
jgi:hypothetical protein